MDQTPRELLQKIISSAQCNGLSKLALKNLIRNGTYVDLAQIIIFEGQGHGNPDEVHALRHSVEKTQPNPERR